MDWDTVLRLLAVIGMAYGAWSAFKRMPPAVRYKGKRYYRQPDGSFRTFWGLRPKDQTIVAGLQSTADDA